MCFVHISRRKRRKNQQQRNLCWLCNYSSLPRHRHLLLIWVFCVYICIPAFVRPWMCAGICAGERASVCQSDSVNIVLCPSNISSSSSAVAARQTVYFPSWRTTSYQISRHCLLACCPTTHSNRMYRPLSPGQDDWQRSGPLEQPIA